MFGLQAAEVQKCSLQLPPEHSSSSPAAAPLSCLSSDSDHLSALNETETLPCLEQLPGFTIQEAGEIRIRWPDQPLFSNNVL